MYKVVYATDLPLRALKRQPNALVEVMSGKYRFRTQRIKEDSEMGGSGRWDAKFIWYALFYLPGLFMVHVSP